MTRTETIKVMMEKARDLQRNGWTREGENEIWDMASDFNREHEDEEIFMCVMSEADGDVGDGFMIEDDYFTLEF